MGYLIAFLFGLAVGTSEPPTTQANVQRLSSEEMEIRHARWWAAYDCERGLPSRKTEPVGRTRSRVLSDEEYAPRYNRWTKACTYFVDL